eukprot:15263-Karenia_brevis.AAC.1
MEEIELDIQTWTAKELALQAQLAKLDTSTSSSEPSPSPNLASQPSPPGLVPFSKILEFKDQFLADLQKPGINTTTAQHYQELFTSSWGH